MSFYLKEANSSEIPLIIAMSEKVWRPTYEPILGARQVDHMLGLFYSPESLQRQMKVDGQEFFICYDKDAAVGFAAIGALPNGGFKLHKLYVLPEAQGTGAGRFMLDSIRDLIASRGVEKLSLNVNRYNKNAIRFYERYGFQLAYEEDIDIGDGYFMNDFVLVLNINASRNMPISN